MNSKYHLLVFFLQISLKCWLLTYFSEVISSFQLIKLHFIKIKILLKLHSIKIAFD